MIENLVSETVDKINSSGLGKLLSQNEGLIRMSTSNNRDANKNSIEKSKFAGNGKKSNSYEKSLQLGMDKIHSRSITNLGGMKQGEKAKVVSEEAGKIEESKSICTEFEEVSNDSKNNVEIIIDESVGIPLEKDNNRKRNENVHKKKFKTAYSIDETHSQDKDYEENENCEGDNDEDLSDDENIKPDIVPPTYQTGTDLVQKENGVLKSNILRGLKIITDKNIEISDMNDQIIITFAKCLYLTKNYADCFKVLLKYGLSLLNQSALSKANIHKLIAIVHCSEYKDGDIVQASEY